MPRPSDSPDPVQLQRDFVALEREIHRLRCEYRRVCEELDYAHERERVLRRVIERLAQEAP